MASLKCKKCGRTFNVTEGQTVCKCEYCGTEQTVSSLDYEKKRKEIEDYFSSHVSLNFFSIKDLSSQLQSLESEADTISKQIILLTSNEDIDDIESKIKEQKEMISSLELQLSKLGFFDGKKKKVISAQIEEHNSHINSYNHEIERFKKENSKIISNLHRNYNETVDKLKEVKTSLQEKQNETLGLKTKLLKLLDKNPIGFDLGLYLTLFKSKVGDKIVFGDYHSSILWRILDKQDGKALLISEEILDAKAFDEKSTTNKWESSSIRTWLNHDFYNEAFTEEEKSIITTGDLQDKVFLLSEDEAKKYFPSDFDREAKVTTYALSNKLYSSNGGRGSWWLRTPWQTTKRIGIYAKIVGSLGGIDWNDGSCVELPCGVRPAMWISIE